MGQKHNKSWLRRPKLYHVPLFLTLNYGLKHDIEPLMTCYPDMDSVNEVAHDTCHQINMHSVTYTRLINFNGKTC